MSILQQDTEPPWYKQVWLGLQWAVYMSISYLLMLAVLAVCGLLFVGALALVGMLISAGGPVSPP